MYLVVEAGRRQIQLGGGDSIYDSLGEFPATPWRTAADETTARLQPSLLNFLLRVFDRYRWDDSADLPVTKVPWRSYQAASAR